MCDYGGEPQALLHSRPLCAADVLSRIDRRAALALLATLPEDGHVNALTRLVAICSAPHLTVAESLAAQDELLGYISGLYPSCAGDLEERARGRDRTIAGINEAVDCYRELR